MVFKPILSHIKASLKVVFHFVIKAEVYICFDGLYDTQGGSSLIDILFLLPCSLSINFSKRVLYIFVSKEKDKSADVEKHPSFTDRTKKQF